MNTFSSQKTYNMTFIEVLLALGLTALLVTSLLSVHLMINNSHKTSKKLCSEIQSSHRVHLRLAQTFKKITYYENLNKLNGDNFFFSEENELYFTFNNGTNIKNWLTGNIMAKLYVNNDSILCLKKYPVKQEDPEHFNEEPLLCDVEKINFEFFHKDIETVKEWEQGKKQLPIIVWLYIYTKNKITPLKLAFELNKKVHRQGNPKLSL